MALSALLAFRASYDSDADAVGRLFVGYLAAGQIDQAYDLTHRLLRVRASREQFRQVFYPRFAQLGRVTEVTGLRWERGTSRGARYARLMYRVHGSAKSATLDLVLKRDEGQWRISSVNLNTDSR